MKLRTQRAAAKANCFEREKHKVNRGIHHKDESKHMYGSKL